MRPPDEACESASLSSVLSGWPIGQETKLLHVLLLLLLTCGRCTMQISCGTEVLTGVLPLPTCTEKLAK